MEKRMRKIHISQHNVEELICKAINLIDDSSALEAIEIHGNKYAWISHADVVRLSVCAAIDYVFQYGLLRDERRKPILDMFTRLYDLDDIVHELVEDVYDIKGIHDSFGFARELDIRGTNLIIIWE